MTKITSAAYAAAGKTLLDTARREPIPYVAGGMSLSGMDCQGLCEYLLIACGVPKAECELKGSNAHWRECLWTGTPEECAARFGGVPEGAWVFIVDYEGGGERARGYDDGMGDANHMGVYLGGDSAIHASSSRGCVAESAFWGKTIRNGGWNAVGLPKWVEYGISSEAGSGAEAGDLSGGGTGEASADISGGAAGKASADMPGDVASKAVYVRVETANGKGVRIREKPSRRAIYKYVAPEGTRLRVIGESGAYHKVMYLGKARWIDRRYAVMD